MADIALRDYVKEIDGLIEHNSYDAAINHCKQILDQYPKCVDAYRLLGKALLEKEDDEAAIDIFQRVLSVDPEDFVARVGLSIVYDRRDEVDKAIWHMERAFDLAPSNEVIQSELRRLYGRRDGLEPERISLTRGALARMYARGDLYAEAITDIRRLMQEQPDQVDLQMLMTEVLWRDDQRVEAQEWAEKIVAKLPYCLNANLILGELWRVNGADGESDEPLLRAQQVDPDNAQAVRLLGTKSPLPLQTTMISHWEPPSYTQLLEAEAVSAETEEMPDWLRGLATLKEPSLIEPPESATNPPLPAGLHMPGAEAALAEIPDWLQGLSAPQAETAPGSPAVELPPSWLAQLGTSTLDSSRVEAPSPPDASVEEEVPDWIKRLGTGMLGQAAPAPEAETPPPQVSDWLKQLGTGALDQTPPSPETAMPVPSEEMPEWLRQLQTGTLDQSAAAPEAEAPAPETLDWLTQLQVNVPPLEEASTESAAPDWLSQLRETTSSIEEVEAPSIAPRKLEVDTDRATIERLVEAFEKPAGPLAAVPPEAEEAAPPIAEVSETMLSADDALAFLARLAQGKEDQLRAEAEQEGVDRMAAIMGRKVEAPKEEPALPAEAPMAEAAPSASAEMPEMMPSADDALAFFARLAQGKEDQLRTQAEQEGAERMAAIMGRKVEAPKEEPPLETAVAPSPEAVEEAAPTPPDELPDWLQALRSTPEMAAAEEATPAEVTPVEEMPDWLRAMQPTAAAEPTPVEEMPDWLRGIRPAATEPEAALEAPPIETAMAEGEEPLAYLQRVADEKAAQLSGEVPLQPEAAMRPPRAEPAPPVETAAPIEMAVPEEMPSAEDALAFLAKLSAGKEEELRQQAEAEATARMEQIVGPVKKPEAPRKPARETHPIEAAAPLVKPLIGEQPPAPVEAVVEERPVTPIEPAPMIEPVTEAAPLGWWVQSAEDENEQPLTELPLPVQMPHVQAVQPAAPRVTRERPTRERAPRARMREIKQRPTPRPTPAITSIDVDPLVTRLQSNANDHTVRLELARAWWSMDNREGALEEYARLSSAAELADEVIADVERIAEIDERAVWSRLLGDLYMKAGKLARALEMYRRALNQL